MGPGRTPGRLSTGGTSCGTSRGHWDRRSSTRSRPSGGRARCTQTCVAIPCPKGCGWARVPTGRFCPMRFSFWSGKRGSPASGQSMQRRGARNSHSSAAWPLPIMISRPGRSSSTSSRSSSSGPTAARTASTFASHEQSTVRIFAAGSVRPPPRTTHGHDFTPATSSGFSIAPRYRTRITFGERGSQKRPEGSVAPPVPAGSSGLPHAPVPVPPCACPGCRSLHAPTTAHALAVRSCRRGLPRGRPERLWPVSCSGWGRACSGGRTLARQLGQAFEVRRPIAITDFVGVVSSR